MRDLCSILLLKVVSYKDFRSPSSAYYARQRRFLYLSQVSASKLHFIMNIPQIHVQAGWVVRSWGHYIGDPRPASLTQLPFSCEGAIRRLFGQIAQSDMSVSSRRGNCREYYMIRKKNKLG